jgi:auxin efflux carrier family protein
VKPVLKLVAIAAAGAIMARRGISVVYVELMVGSLTQAVLKGMSAVIINVFMPCLLFSKTVPSFTAENLGEVGVLILTAVFYQSTTSSRRIIVVCGLLFGLIVRCATPLPAWRNGVLFAGMFSNWGISLAMIADVGDIPLAFVMTIAASKPFTSEDQALGIAYVSVIIVWCFLTMFPFGGWMLIQRDFDLPLPRNDIEERGSQTLGTRWNGLHILSRLKPRPRRQPIAKPECISTEKTADPTADSKPLSTSKIPLDTPSRTPSISIHDLDIISPIISHPSIHSLHIEQTELQDLSLAATPSLSRHRSLTPLDPLWKRAGRKVARFLLSLISPPAIAILLSLSIALVPVLKALFVPGVPGTDIPDAPDGMPPLAWILDIASFGGTQLSNIANDRRCFRSNRSYDPRCIIGDTQPPSWITSLVCPGLFG